MNRHYFFAVILGLILAGMQATNADEQDITGYMNDRSSFPKHHRWGIFFGTGWTTESLELIQRWEQEGKWIDPFTQQPFDDVQVFVFGQKNPVLEGLRVVSDHLEIHALSSSADLKGYHFDFVICHSNGCPKAMDYQRSGLISADTFFALGTDWTSKNFRPGDLKGAEIYFFVTKGDPIWKIPAPEWARITEDTPGLKFSVPFNHPKEIPQGLRNWFTRGRADPDTLPVILLDTPAGQKRTVLKPFRPHGLMESYFPAIGEWMQSEGRLQKALREKIRALDASSTDDHKKVAPFPPGGGGGGGGAQGSKGGSSPHGPGQPLLPTTPGADPRGGVSAEIRIHPQDFDSQ